MAVWVWTGGACLLVNWKGGEHVSSVLPIRVLWSRGEEDSFCCLRVYMLLCSHVCGARLIRPEGGLGRAGVARPASPAKSDQGAHVMAMPHSA